MPLTPDERALVCSYATQGEIVLRQRGWNAEQRKAFLIRKDVNKELTELEELYKDRDGLAERAKFFGLMEVQRMVPRAVDILRRRLLAGTTLSDGTKIEAPDEDVSAAANDVLNRAGVEAGKTSDHDDFNIRGDIHMNNLNLNSASGADDNLGGVMLREKLRTALSTLLSKNTKLVTSAPGKKYGSDNKKKTHDAGVIKDAKFVKVRAPKPRDEDEDGDDE